MKLPLPRSAADVEPPFAGMLASALHDLYGSDVLAEAGALVARAILEGHTYADVPPDLLQRLVGAPLGASFFDTGPLRLNGTRLCLARYHDYEQSLAQRLQALNKPIQGIAEKALRDQLNRHFPPDPDLQRRAAATAVQRQLCVISGGPGTGKTATVVKILAILLTLQPKLRIAIAAPTGKAAARVQESIRAQIEGLQLPEAVAQVMPREPYTVHRLLRYQHGQVSFRHNKNNRLPYDVVVVDEASMLDLALAAKLVEALHDDARLILLGDKDQLSSVEAGAVFAGIARRDNAPLADAVVWLEHSWRFGADSALGRLARAINAGDAPATTAILRSGDPAVTWHESLPPPRALAEQLIEGFTPYIEAIRSGKPPEEIFKAFDAFRVLCSTREGRYGSARLGPLLLEALRRRLGVPGAQAWFTGRPILVTANDYALRLFNGDVGIVLPGPSGAPLIHLQDADGRLRTLSPTRLGDVQDALAITVHRAQGSEFGRVAVVIEPELVRGLSRQLVYTAVTRAKREVVLYAAEVATTFA